MDAAREQQIRSFADQEDDRCLKEVLAALDQARAENDRLMEIVCSLAGKLGLFDDYSDPSDDAPPVSVPPELRERLMAEVQRRMGEDA